MKKTLFITLSLLLLIALVVFYFYEKPTFQETPPAFEDPLFSDNIKIEQPIDLIIVEKSARNMTVFHQKVAIKRYKVALGFEPIGPKRQQGDGKTPEGEYFISAKNPNSRFHLSLKISYPSKSDKQFAKENQLSPGGEIMIHGLAEPFALLGKKHRMRDWTLGCIALTNDEIEEIYAHVNVGTKIIIKP